MSADTAYRLACEGTGLLWQGDFHNARQLLQALARRTDRKPKKNKTTETNITPMQAFNLHRQALGQRARILAMVIVPLNGDYSIPLRRAPDLTQACTEAWGPANGEACMVSLRELLGVVGAHEWRKKGVEVAALGEAPNNRIHPHYGVFSPVRGEYVDLVAQAPLPQPCNLAFDIGVGSGVLSAVLAKRGIPQIIATDIDPRALACAQDNLQRLGYAPQVSICRDNLFPSAENAVHQADLIVCNPPWLPTIPTSPIEAAIYDPESRMLRQFLSDVAERLTPSGEAWLILSDIAEHLQLRSRDELLGWIKASGLVIAERLDTRPRHPKTRNNSDALHKARSQEITSLWRLKKA